ncbi:hypothetical protein DAEQUDRAFT_742304 [Daedalea quercina L-15889]|uniref:DNA repair protein RAD14 n=1 Tax=Daedalea quercina L-15889 TaxID=1314783 RepID=A0A165UG26_9APHY|nr:hypothetical protein DAEQUDRAFT_742304 [Daedalea quercina L-15889]
MEEGSSSAAKFSTPPPRPPESLDLTPEQVKRIELNRLKAKARQRERELEAAPSAIPNSQGKRTMGVVPANSTSPTAPKPPPRLKRDSRLGKYFEYDLSKMVNSKGGFLVEDGKEVDDQLLAKEKERERQRAIQNLDPPLFLDHNLNPKCAECQSVDIDQTYRKIFGCLVCNRCKNEKPEKYSLLTKTECKEDYLLTDAELRDQELMPHLLKANPHKSTFANMMLFLRCQVEDFAWKKWGSPEALDTEWERRTAEKKKKKNKKFEEGLKELRRRTRETVWQKRKDREHKHVFGVVEKGSDGVGKQVLNDRQEEHEQMSTSLEVEPLDTNLFRSKSLWLPIRARGVYGGQVISQALVSATNCVSADYALHCYFLLSVSPAAPIIYQVVRVRDGRSYVTRTVTAIQRGRAVFVMLCSFQKPELGQPVHQWPMPPKVPSPEECEEVQEYYERMLRRKDLDPRLKAYADEYIEERRKSPMGIKTAGITNSSDGATVYMWWFKARNIPKYDAPFQKVRPTKLSNTNRELTDPLRSIGVVRRTLGLNSHTEGPKQLTINSFDCGDWILYVVESPRAGNGRGVVHGRMYTRSGTLIAVTSQEGVIRAQRDIPAQRQPQDIKAKI